MYKCNVGIVLKMNILRTRKISSKLKVWCFKIPHYAYTHRYAQDKKTSEYVRTKNKN